MRHLALIALFLLTACATGRAQTAPLVGTTLRTTSTAAGSVKVGCTQTGPCTGGLSAGAADVASVTSAGFIEIANNVPGSQTFRLVNNAGTLQWNGVALATGSSLSGTLNTIPLFTGASSVGNSIITQNVGATIITVAGALNATTLGGTLSTATQNSVTTMTGLVSVGTITTGVWSGTIVTLAKGGTGVDLSGTGGTSQFLRQNTLGGTVTVVRPAITDLSDGTNVALLNATNTFTVASGQQGLQPSTGTNAARWAFTNTGGSSAVGADDSTGGGGSGAPYSLLVFGGTTGGIALRANDATGTIRLFTGGGNLRWGINAAGDWTFGTSAHVADSVGTPAVASGFGGSTTIVGTDYAFRVTNGAAPNNGVVIFGHTWTTVPICTLMMTLSSGGASSQTVGGLPTTTNLTISFSGGGDASGQVYVLCRSY